MKKELRKDWGVGRDASTALSMTKLAAAAGGGSSHGADSAWPRSRGRFSHSAQQFLQYGGIIVRFVFRGEEQSQTLALMREMVELSQGVFGFRPCEFFEIFLAKGQPVVGAGVVPAAQIVGRSEIAQPLVDLRALFGETARPETVDQHPRPVRPGCRFVNSLDRNRHHFPPALSL